MIADCIQISRSPDPYAGNVPAELAAAGLPQDMGCLPALQRPLAKPDVPSDLEPLTLREREIMTWIARGKTDWQTGHILEISAKTVNFHVERAKRKFGAVTRAQAIVIAGNLGQLDAPVSPMDLGKA